VELAGGVPWAEDTERYSVGRLGRGSKWCNGASSRCCVADRNSTVLGHCSGSVSRSISGTAGAQLRYRVPLCGGGVRQGSGASGTLAPPPPSAGKQGRMAVALRKLHCTSGVHGSESLLVDAAACSMPLAHAKTQAIATHRIPPVALEIRGSLLRGEGGWLLGRPPTKVEGPHQGGRHREGLGAGPWPQGLE
jgi:hypothetical protein